MNLTPLLVLALSVSPALGVNPMAWGADVLPAIAPVDQRFLTRVARRTVDARLRDEPAYEVGYVPPALAGVNCQMMVTLRDGGYARGIGTSTNLPVVAATQEAALVALGSARGGLDLLTSLDGIRFELQALGPVRDYTASRSWTLPGAIDDFLDPGLHGVRLFLDDEGRWFTPAEMISRCLSLDDALRILGKEITLDSRVLNEARLSRFRTLHWWEVDDEGHVVTLHRGMLPVSQDDVTRRALDKAIEDVAEYIVQRQRADGWFSAMYDPAADKYTLDDEPVMQAGACWALAVYAARAKDHTVAVHVERGLRAQRAYVMTMPTGDEAAFVATADQANPLALTAQYCLALSAQESVGTAAVDPEDRALTALRPRLVRGMHWLQRDDGRFLTAFPPSQQFEPQDRVPGMALLALAESHRIEPSAGIADALAAALPYYRRLFVATDALAMAPWHAQAYVLMAERTRRADYAEFAFELCDRVCADQYGPENQPDPALWGAIANDRLPAGAGTAAFVAGLADAARLARLRGDGERAARYLEACRRGARFILQLQFKSDECYYVRSPRDAVGGVRSTPTHVRLHLDSCQHALLALMKCRDLLFSDEPWPDQP